MLGRMASETGREPSKLLVSSHSFEDAVVQRMGSSVFAQRLFESQNPGACLRRGPVQHLQACSGLKHLAGLGPLVTACGAAILFQTRRDVTAASSMCTEGTACAA